MRPSVKSLFHSILTAWLQTSSSLTLEFFDMKNEDSKSYYDPIALLSFKKTLTRTSATSNWYQSN